MMITRFQIIGLRQLWSVLLAAAVLLGLLSCKAPAPQVVVYTSMDQNYAEPVLQRFQQETGIEVKPVYDTEATKTTGLANRLLAEKANPTADVFWNSEIGRTILLHKEGVFQAYTSPNAADIPATFKESYGFWTGFAGRVRVLAYNTTLLSAAEAPRTLEALTDVKWKGKVALAYPLFGTTSIHSAALFTLWGEERAKAYFLALKENDVRIVDGNASAVAKVESGEVLLTFTDTDDAYSALQRGAPIGIIFPDQEGMGSLLIPNTVGMIKGCRHPEEARRFIDYMLSPAVEQQLAASPAAVFPLRGSAPARPGMPAVGDLKTMSVDFEHVAAAIPSTTAFLKDLFVR